MGLELLDIGLSCKVSPECWVTGLRLAALTLHKQSDRSRILKNLPEDNRYIMNYILSEVLSQQSPPIHKNSKFLVAVLIRDM